MTEAARATVPPEARVATAQGNAMAHVIAQLIELTLVLGAVWLRSIDKLSEDSLIWVLPVLLGPGIAKARGLVPQATIVTLLALGPGFAKAALLSVGLLLGSCSPAALAAITATLPALLEAAGPHLEALAADKGVTLDKNLGICIEVPTDAMVDLLPEEYAVPVVVIMCGAPALD